MNLRLVGTVVIATISLSLQDRVWSADCSALSDPAAMAALVDSDPTQVASLVAVCNPGGQSGAGSPKSSSGESQSSRAQSRSIAPYYECRNTQ